MNLRNKKFIFGILCILFCLNILAWLGVWELNKPRFLEVNFFDVGQGDAIFIESPQNHQILIDGGPGPVILEKLSKEMPFWDNTLDLIILTHPERDHLMGLLEVLKRYRVKNILWTGIIRDTSEFKEWENLIKKEKAQIKIAQSGQKIKIQKIDSCDFQKKSEFCSLILLEILYPFEKLEGREFKNSNNTSVVSRLVFNENTFLFTGDISKSVEEKLIFIKDSSSGFSVLKVAHHGSKTSSSEKFINKILPKIAVIQVGENKYGHPHPETLLTLEKFGTKILRTDKVGDIKIISNGKNLQFKTKKYE